MTKTYKREYVGEMRSLLERAYKDIVSMRESGDAGFWDESQLEKDIKNFLTPLNFEETKYGPWINTLFCFNCKAELSHNVKMNSHGRCPLCGVKHKDACTIIECIEGAKREVKEGPNKGHWEYRND